MSRRNPELDGLRGVAALLVVMAHYFGETPHGLVVLTWGWLGVGIFFVLSGYLIGSIILDEHTRPDFFKYFYLRRAARILPVYLVTVLATLAIVAIFADKKWIDRPLPLPVYLTFTQNIVLPMASAGGGRWLLPTWTLAVEEQFYLVIPALIVFTPRRWLPHVLGALWLSAIVFRLLVYDKNNLAALSLLPSRADLLLSGVIAALIDRRFDLRRRLMILRITPLACVLALLAISLIDKNRTFTIANPLLLGVGAASFILSIVHGAPEGHRFRAPLLGFFGRISYALYLVHQPIGGLLHGLLLNARPDVATPAAIGVSVLAVGASVGLAWASWAFMEAPILDLARRSRDRAPLTDPFLIPESDR